ncbi:MAG: Hpt domain-containing protein [Acidobacteriota bacterium]
MEQDLIDMARLDERMEGDRELIREVFSVFVEEAPTRRDRFEKAVADLDVATLVMLAHSLKGASSTLQAEPLRQASQALEIASRENRTGELAALAASVLDLLDKTAQAMDEMKGSL